MLSLPSKIRRGSSGEEAGLKIKTAGDRGGLLMNLKSKRSDEELSVSTT